MNNMTATEEHIKLAKEWRQIAYDNKLTIGEMYALLAYVESIKKLANKN
jgi:hypothetical protein